MHVFPVLEAVVVQEHMMAEIFNSGSRPQLYIIIIFVIS
jgi:hypothetical protein